MNNSSRFFANTECEYYPCHTQDTDLNCLFCYCPLYTREHCPGTFKMIPTEGGRLIKSCLDCTFPHKAENYDTIMQFLKHPER